MKKAYTRDWTTRFRAGTELEATEDERCKLNATIASIAADGCRMYIGEDSGINHQMQKAAKKMMHLARRRNEEPLHALKEVCDAYPGLGVYPESFLIVTKYAE